MAKKNPAVKVEKAPAQETSLAEQVDQEVFHVYEALKTGPLFEAKPSEVETAVAVAAWSVLDAIDDACEDRKNAYREHLLGQAEKEGVETDKGGFRLWVENSEVIKEKRQAKLPEEDELKAMMKEKGISYSECYDEVKTLKLNPSKLDYLIETGRLDAKEIEKLKKVSWALKVKPSEPIQQTLDKLVNQLLGNPPGTKRLKSRS